MHAAAAVLPLLRPIGVLPDFVLPDLGLLDFAVSDFVLPDLVVVGCVSEREVVVGVLRGDDTVLGEDFDLVPAAAGVPFESPEPMASMVIAISTMTSAKDPNMMRRRRQ